jgi:hypothetical protein
VATVRADGGGGSPSQSSSTARSNRASQQRYEGLADYYAKLYANTAIAGTDNIDTSGGQVGGPPPVSGGGGGPSAADIAAQKAAAAEAAAKKAGKDKTARENKATQDIIDALLGSLKGYASGRDQSVKNANEAFEQTLAGILANYNAAVGDYNETLTQNEMDQAGKSASNVTNRARERTSLLQQAASMGAGGTDQLRAMIMAFMNADQNQMEVDRAFYDTQRSVNSQIAGANSQAASQRMSADAQLGEALGTAWGEYWKNYTDTMTNVQRTGAQNSNIDSDYSTGFKADYGGYDPVKEAAKYAGKVYDHEEKSQDWGNTFEGKQHGRDVKTASSNRAGAVTINAPKQAEGATLRGRW